MKCRTIAIAAVMAAVFMFMPFSAEQYSADDSDICGPSLVETDPSPLLTDGGGSTGGTGAILRVGNSAYSVGDVTGTIGVYMEGSPEISVLDFSVTFNPDHFTPVAVTSSGLLVMNSYSISENVITFGFVSEDPLISQTSTGLLVTIGYETKNDAACGTYPVFIDKQLSKDGNGNLVQAECISGTVLISGVPGDINGDGIVSISDSLSILYILLDSGREIGSADLNNDGAVNSKDSLLLRKYLAGWNVDLVASYASGSDSASVFGHIVMGIGYGAVYVSSDEIFAVMKNNTVSEFEHDIGNSYRTDLRPGVGLVIKDGSSVQSDERSIAYYMNGGNFDCSMPLSYKPGGIYDLGCPTNDDKTQRFMGWYTDSACTDLMLYIPSDDTSDLHLYALWSDTIIGHGFAMDYRIDVIDNGYVTNSSYTVEGTYEASYWAYDEDKGTLIRDYYTMSVDGGEISSQETIDWSGTGSGDDTMTDSGIVTVNIGGWNTSAHKYTAVSDNGDVVQNEYYIYGWLPAMIEIESTAAGDQYTSVYVLNDILSFSVPEVCHVTIYEGRGIQASQSTIAAVGDTVVLTADASSGTFGGWYDTAGNLISSDETLNLGNIISDITLVAKNGLAYDRFFEGDEDIEIQSSDDGAVWTLINMDTLDIEKQSVGSTFFFKNSGCGYHELLVYGVTEDSVPFYDAWFLATDDTVTRNYQWVPNDSTETQSVSLEISYSDVLTYRNSAINRTPGIFNPDVNYVTYNDPAVAALAEWMSNKTSDMSAYDALNYVLSFVQSAIPYQTDQEGMGVTEYWKYPLETLFDGKGDCEDTAILYCALTKAMGYDTVLITFYGHAASGINISELGFDSTYVEKVYFDKNTYRGYNEYCYYLKANGNWITYVYQCSSNYYFYCETTSAGWHVGDYSGDLNAPYNSYYSSLNVIRVVRVV